MSTTRPFADRLPLIDAPAHVGGAAHRPQSRAAADRITRGASKQTYATIRLMADRGRALNAFQAYAYFRWVDDVVDGPQARRDDNLRFIERQQRLLDTAYAGAALPTLSAEEQMLVDLIAGDPTPDTGLALYLRHMMAVMAFDVERRGRLVSADALTQYTANLAIAVTEALHYFIGRDQPTPPTVNRYRAVTGAHVTHLLRDTFEDVEAGYYNIAREFAEANGLTPTAVRGDGYREWVRQRVAQARADFAAGRAELAQVQNRRCRLAGAAYIARFETVLDAIERDDYHLRREYNERKTARGVLCMAGSVLRSGAW